MAGMAFAPDSGEFLIQRAISSKNVRSTRSGEVRMQLPSRLTPLFGTVKL